MTRQKFILSALAALAVAALAYPSVKLLLYDMKVSRLCEQDGGYHIYETVPLSADQFDNLGTPLIRLADYSTPPGIPDLQYYIAGQVTEIAEGWPSVRRLNSRIIRLSDGKLLGEQVKYVRSGGGYLAFIVGHDLNVCPGYASPGNSNDGFQLRKLIFKKVLS